MNWKVLKTEAEYNKATMRMMEIFHAEPGTLESDELDLLIVLIKDYDDKHYQLPELDALAGASLQLVPFYIKNKMNQDIQAYNNSLSTEDRDICNLLAQEITRNLPEAENKIWHAHPVWFLTGNPIAGYSKLKNCVRLLFWSGQSFDEEALQKEGTFKAAEVRYTSAEQINKNDLKRWLEKAKEIQWDYKNLIKRKGVLERLK